MKILKIGGSVLTEKEGYREPDGRALYRMAKTLASLWKKGLRDLVLVHEAGSFGHSLVLKYGIDNGITSEAQKVGFADTHASCSDLSLLLVNGLVLSGVPAVTIPPAAIVTQKNRRISSFNKKIIQDYLEMGFLPVLHGDMVLDEKLGGSVCSGDQIVAYLGKQAEFIVLATNVDGVLDDKGKVIPQITKSNFKKLFKHLKLFRDHKDVTGAMKGKIQELLELDTPSYIVNGDHPERVADLLLGKKTLCTVVKK